MKISKSAVSVTLLGLFAANVAMALPGFTKDAPQSSVDTCLAEVSANADYKNGSTVYHRVETEEHRVAGHKMNIQTLIYDADGETVIREYATHCAINDKDEIRRFKIRQKEL
ncbi:MAG: hypothetical protein AAFN50_15640 [Pseudomonadota bacterium]